MQVGDKVGRYQLGKRIGEGGMAQVFASRHPVLERDVAIKVLKRESCSDAQYVARFLDDARSAHHLEHPNIVRVLDVDESDGQPFIVMELVDGESLDRWSAGRRIETSDAVRVARDVAGALAAAHAAGLVHRDVKPSNILMDRRTGAAKLTDFGVAKRERTDGMQLTGVGQRIGTPRYMAPEQVEGGAVDARTDLFAFGATVYELLAGEPAFRGGSVSALFHAILFGTPRPLSEVRPDLPAELIALIDRLLSKAPDGRPASAAEVIATLDTLLPDRSEGAAPSAPRTEASSQPGPDKDASYELREFRLFLEEICCELCRCRHTDREGLPAEQVSIAREVRLGPPRAFADIKVIPAGGAPYFVEIKWGYRKEELIHRLVRKYAASADDQCRKLIIVTDLAGDADSAEIGEQLRHALCPTLEVEMWGEQEVLRQIDEFFGLKIESLRRGNYRAIRASITRAEWAHAFGSASDDPLAPVLLWHFSSWSLKRLHRDLGLRPDAILQPGVYRNVAVLMADLCSFSSYVRDSPDDTVVRQSLTTFYSQARQAILDTGGMLDQFVGDEVIALFGFPDRKTGYADDAVRCAGRLIDVGNSVSEHWQRRIDRVQRSGGVHVGIAIGDLNLMPLRAFSGSHFGFIGDAINMTARLVAAAGPSEVLISNGLYHALDMDAQPSFEELEPVEGKNIGTFRCWRMSNGYQTSDRPAAPVSNETAPDWRRPPMSI